MPFEDFLERERRRRSVVLRGGAFLDSLAAELSYTQVAYTAMLGAHQSPEIPGEMVSPLAPAIRSAAISVTC